MRRTSEGYSSNQEDAPKSTKFPSYRFLIVCLLTFAVVAMLYSVSSPHEVPGPAFEESTLDTNGAYVMKDFDKRKPMANFLNGIGGVWGIPMWAFYVNRGQVFSFLTLLNLLTCLLSPCILAFLVSAYLLVLLLYMIPCFLSYLLLAFLFF